MGVIKVFYEKSGNDLTVVLRVRRHVKKRWQKPERDIREILSRELENVNWNGVTKREELPRSQYLLRWIRDDLHLPKYVENRLMLGDVEHYHQYRGPVGKLPTIQSYCTDNRIEMQEGIEARVRRFLN